MDARRFIRRHSESGYVIMSAERSVNSRKENEEATAQMCKCFRDYGFVPRKVYGGYVMYEDGTCTQEVSLLLLPYDKDGKRIEDGKFFILCRILGDRFRQESILVKEGRYESPYLWYCADGNSVFLSGKVVYNDASQAYYTDFRKGTDGKLDIEKRATRFSFV